MTGRGADVIHSCLNRKTSSVFDGTLFIVENNHG